MKTLNYQRLTNLNPTIYTTIVNQLGQSIDLVEHPIEGDVYPVIAIYHKEKVAVITDFFDTEDMEQIGDYTPVYMHGEMKCAFDYGF